MNIQTVKYIGRGITLAFIIIIGFGYYAISQCVNTVMMDELSPNNLWKVVVFERSCGSLTGKSTHISILKKEQVLENTSGNIYVAEDYPEGYFVEWLSDSSVKVSGVKGENHLKVETHEGVSVIYE